jgi:phage terminase small subunit
VPLPAKGVKLTPAEKDAWAMFGELVGEMRVTNKSDTVAFRLMVSTYVDAEILRAQINELDGKVTYDCPTASGAIMVRPHPLLALLDNADLKLVKLMARFGLTPSDRARVHDQGTGNGGRAPGSGDDEFTQAG